MSLIDEVERLGRAVDASHLTADQAAHQLYQFSDGGLTYAGACDLIDRWDSARADYEAIFTRAARSLAAMHLTLADLDQEGQAP